MSVVERVPEKKEHGLLLQPPPFNPWSFCDVVTVPSAHWTLEKRGSCRCRQEHADT